MAQAVVHAEALPPVKGLGINLKTAGQIVRMHSLGPSIAQLLLAGAAGELQPGLVEVVAFLVGAGGPDQRPTGIGQRAVALFLLPQLFLRPLALRDVMEQLHHRRPALVFNADVVDLKRPPAQHAADLGGFQFTDPQRLFQRAMGALLPVVCIHLPALLAQHRPVHRLYHRLVLVEDVSRQIHDFHRVGDSRQDGLVQRQRFLRQPLRLHLRRDIDRHHAAARAGGIAPGFQPGDQRRPAFRQQRQLEVLDLGAAEHLREKMAESFPVALRHQQAETRADQVAARHAQELGPGEVQLADGAVLGEGEIARRRKIIKFRELVQGQRGFRRRRAQFLILHLQLDLVHFQLLLQPAHLVLGLWQAGAVLFFQLRLGFRSQNGGATFFRRWFHAAPFGCAGSAAGWAVGGSFTSHFKLAGRQSGFQYLHTVFMSMNVSTTPLIRSSIVR